MNDVFLRIISWILSSDYVVVFDSGVSFTDYSCHMFADSASVDDQ